MENLRIDGERLWASLMEMARIGATEKGGVRRLTLSDLDREARDLLRRWCEEAGCAVTVDAMGNMFARRPGRDPERPPVMSGSHLDSQPTGGKFDGAFGVLAALEVVRTLNDLGVETEAPIEIVNWTNEEGSRFSPAMMGSGVWAGVFPLGDTHAKQDVDGHRLGDELRRIGYLGEAPAVPRPVDSYFECHIEQGPILEREGKSVGIVTGAQGQRWYEVTVTGMEAHAGPTPMDVRRDALVGASRMIEAINRIGLAHAPNARTTVGFVQVRPNSRNVIPGEVFFAIDTRHPEDAVLARMREEIRAACAAIAGEAGLAVEVKDFWYFPPTPFHEDCLAAIRKGVERGEHAAMEIISGAGHDAVYMAGVAPTGMIFVPCENGISHNEAENAKPEDLAAGCQVLLHAVLERAGRIE